MHHFRTTAVYDPDYTGTGHQPYGFDQHSRLYNHYIVDTAIITQRSASQGSCLNK
jgi:hypothetical protein